MAETGDIGELREQARAFRKMLLELKTVNPPDGFTWYGYEILGNLTHLDNLLSAPNRDIFNRVKGRPILDVGAADGDFAFFLESMGHSVDVIDLPTTNWNGLRGARRLKELLSSRVEIRELDVDATFQLERKYGLVLFLGILYHLRNPFLAIEKFSTCAEYMVLSTRVARRTADGRTQLDDASVGYFLDPDECNNDATNWWIFSRAGLRKLVRRAGWEIVDEMSVGDTRASNPSSADHDERVFMLLRSLR